MGKNEGITVRNLYTVRLGSVTVGAYNNLTPGFLQRAMEDPAWARYFVIKKDSGQVVVCSPKLESVNSDPSRGIMRVTYTGEFDTERGAKYVRVSLCRENRLSGEMSGSDVEFTGDGERAYITAKLNITEAGESNVRFCSGDNPLARALLGCGKTATYKLSWGECDFPSKTCSRNIGSFRSVKTVSYSSAPSSLTFKSGTTGTGKEVVIFANDVAALRAVLPYTNYIRPVGEMVASGEMYKRFSHNIPEALLSMALDGDVMLAPEICPEYTRADELKADFGISLGYGGYVTSDPAGEYVGVVTNGYVDVYRADVPMLERVSRVKRTDEYVEVLRAGDVALWSKTKLRIFSKEDGDNPVFTMAVKNPTLRCVLRVGMYYHAMYDEGSTFKRIMVDEKGNVSTLETVTPNNKSGWFITRCGDRIAYGYNSLNVKSIMADESVNYRCDAISSSPTIRTVYGVGDCFLVCSEGGETKFYDFVANKCTSLPISPAKCLGKLVYGGGKVYTYSYGGGLSELECNEDLSGITSAALAGDGLYTVIDGKLRVFYLSRCALTLKLPKYAGGMLLKGMVRERVVSGSGKKPTVTLTST